MSHKLKARRFVLGSVTAICASTLVGGVAGPANSMPTSFTVLPELQAAVVAGTTTADQATASRPAGTWIVYRFDEALDGSVSTDPTDFVVYDKAGNPLHADVATVKNDTVRVLFKGLDTPALEVAQELASTAGGAVTDQEGSVSPAGAVGVTHHEVSTQTGFTDCPALEHVDNVRPGERRTEVDFVFNCLWGGNLSVKATGFHLDLTDGQAKSGIRRWVHQDAGVVTVAFRGRIRARRIGRGTIDAGAVSISEQDAIDEPSYDVPNALESAPLTHHGHTAAPDLVRVRLRPDSRVNHPDRAFFMFDQRVRRPVDGRFVLYPVTHGSVGINAAKVKGHPRWVRVDVGPDAIHRALAAGVRDGGVRGALAEGVAVTNTFHYTYTSDGITSAPQLDLMEFDPSKALLTGDFYLGDSVVGEPTESAFHLYAQNGHEWTADHCALVTTPYGRPVECTFPVDAPQTGTLTLLATVDANAVQDTEGRGNPAAGHLGLFTSCVSAPTQWQCDTRSGQGQ